MKSFLCVVVLIFLFFSVWTVFIPKNTESGMVVFKIEKGQGVREIGQKLQDQGIIKSKYFFLFYVLSTGKKLKAGDYEVSSSMNIAEIVRKMNNGDVAQRKVTIIEGWTVKDMKKYFSETGISGEIDENLQGYLFPDTYVFSFEADAEEVISAMQKNFEKKVTTELKNEIISQGKTLEEVVKMASLLEKEVITYKDKQKVAGLLWKRIKAGMPLQVDAARETYEHKGLPERPICNPGLESIKAAIYPIETDYWFYLSAPDGETIFSRDLAEHNLAIKKYLK